MLRMEPALEEAGLRAKMILQVHDELVFEVGLKWKLDRVGGDWVRDEVGFVSSLPSFLGSIFGASVDDCNGRRKGALDSTRTGHATHQT